jgi:hypothetical protein
MGHAGQLFPSEAGALFFSRRGETQGFWNLSAATRLWVLKAELSSAGRQRHVKEVGVRLG